MSKYFLNIQKNNSSQIFNKISNTEGDSVYPDIWFDHPFEEASIIDDKLFETALEASKEYGSSNILFATVADEKDELFLRNIFSSAFEASNVAPDNSKITCFCEDLMLTEAMKQNFNKLMDYYILTGNNPEDLIDPFYSEYPLPVKNKNEGKMLYDIIRNKILG